MTAPARPLARRWKDEWPGSREHNALVAAHEADRALIETLVTALTAIAAFDDIGANEHLAAYGSYDRFDEPASARLARAALAAAGRAGR